MSVLRQLLDSAFYESRWEMELDFIMWRYYELKLLRREQPRATDDGMPERVCE